MPVCDIIYMFLICSLQQGESEVEVMAAKIEQQRADRIPVTKNVRRDFLKTCRHIAEGEDCPNSMIPERCLLAYHEEVKAEVEARKQAAGHFRKFCTYLGFLDDKVTMLNVLDRALIRVNDTDDDFFHYQDFSFYNTKLVSRWPWLRNPITVACTVMLFFYILTPVWFCHIVPGKMKQGIVCFQVACESFFSHTRVLVFDRRTSVPVRPRRRPLVLWMAHVSLLCVHDNVHCRLR